MGKIVYIIYTNKKKTDSIYFINKKNNCISFNDFRSQFNSTDFIGNTSAIKLFNNYREDT